LSKLPSDRNLFREETDDPLYADKRNFFKVEKWTRDGTKVDSLLYAGNSPVPAPRADSAEPAGAFMVSGC
jgi:hypothetical protein